jgi:hypothetical protein
VISSGGLKNNLTARSFAHKCGAQWIQKIDIFSAFGSGVSGGGAPMELGHLIELIQNV